MEYPGTTDHVKVHLVLRQRHISARIAVKRKTPVTRLIHADKCKGGVHLIRHHKSAAADSRFPDSSAKEPSMDVVSNLADESGAPAVSCQHGQDIAWSASRVLFQDRVALGADSRRCKIYQKLAEGNNVIFLLIFHSNQTPPVYISFIISL